MDTNAEGTGARANAIMTAEAAKGREALAKHLAYETDLDFETAIAVLAAGPAEPPLDRILRNYRAATGQ
ncbi:hypothetical protein [Bosea sp. BIWAKO-01]|uniref:hypothetical protein n=1 Tax=Bosea sp. BIWAKO-01 TaxID=506668 RepID=UPI0008530B2B|nr:hypothetical protein [Bosea sp. BIWAKO-01]GAU80570.1 hypothetical protein BIWAKO_00458 [Bosea sp. BIWAKO-01]